MGTKLYVYTGTGNSLWIARQLALELKDAALQFMPLLSKEIQTEADRVGIIFPVHIWGLPSHVIQFIHHLQVKPETYLFACCSYKKSSRPGGERSPWAGPLSCLQITLPGVAPDRLTFSSGVSERLRKKSRPLPERSFEGSGKRWTGDLSGRTSSFPGSIRCLSDRFTRWTRNSGWMINAIVVESVRRSARLEISR
jgi:hypothetical protein